MDNNKQPLISIVVLSYNSDNYILSTLESIKCQTYKKLELIITDDCSKDNTVQVVEKWLLLNKGVFSNIQFLKSPINTGVAANCNRGFKLAKGDYIKAIAGDDILYSDCIEQNVNYLLTYKTDILFSKTTLFFEENVNEEFRNNLVKIKEYTDINNEKVFSKLNVANQFKNLMYGCSVSAPSALIKRAVIEQLDWFNESIPTEDYPLWLKATYNGFRISYLNKETVKYRINRYSLSHGAKPERGKTKLEKLMEIEKAKYLTFTYILSNPFFCFDYWLVNKLNEISSNAVYLKLFLNLFKLISPFYFYRTIRKYILLNQSI